MCLPSKIDIANRQRKRVPSFCSDNHLMASVSDGISFAEHRENPKAYFSLNDFFRQEFNDIEQSLQPRICDVWKEMNFVRKDMAIFAVAFSCGINRTTSRCQNTRFDVHLNRCVLQAADPGRNVKWFQHNRGNQKLHTDSVKQDPLPGSGTENFLKTMCDWCLAKRCYHLGQC